MGLEKIRQNDRWRCSMMGDDGAPEQSNNWACNPEGVTGWFNVTPSGLWAYPSNLITAAIPLPAGILSVDKKNTFPP